MGETIRCITQANIENHCLATNKNHNKQEKTGLNKFEQEPKQVQTC